MILKDIFENSLAHKKREFGALSSLSTSFLISLRNISSVKQKDHILITPVEKAALQTVDSCDKLNPELLLDFPEIPIRMFEFGFVLESSGTAFGPGPIFISGAGSRISDYLAVRTFCPQEKQIICAEPGTFSDITQNNKYQAAIKKYLPQVAFQPKYLSENTGTDIMTNDSHQALRQLPNISNLIINRLDPNSVLSEANSHLREGNPVENISLYLQGLSRLLRKVANEGLIFCSVGTGDIPLEEVARIATMLSLRDAIEKKSPGTVFMSEIPFIFPLKHQRHQFSADDVDELSRVTSLISLITPKTRRVTYALDMLEDQNKNDSIIVQNFRQGSQLIDRLSSFRKSLN